eukprot:TRINITY_DN11584_c0_g1_i4.p1 TRINITY_DN11584_c0_g1~~TRINITY_DN11584_c0_g1_i4.p1  ORF type:complete len:462 (+),score=84.07 TRINITY_DN11584_c0_g1_i4:111-1496(+)
MTLVSATAAACDRCILVLDVDAFYAQVEEVNGEPGLGDRPLAVYQKFLVITCNYPARARGVTKLMRKEEALAKCPELILRSAEDTTPYRRASQQVLQALQRWAGMQTPAGTVLVERLGMEEFCLDVSAAACARRQAGELRWHGHVYRSEQVIVPEEKLAGRERCFRPRDLRAAAAPASSSEERALPAVDSAASTEYRTLAAGSSLAADVRACLVAETRLRASCGIGSNRLLAKLAAGLHKPNAQTTLTSTEAAALLTPMPVNVLPGVGYRLGQRLRALGVETVASLRDAPLRLLLEALQVTGGKSFAEAEGDATSPSGEVSSAARLQALARGEDNRPVRAARPSQRISVEDSFRKCASLEGLRAVLKVLTPDLLARIREDGREPRRYAVSWRVYGSRTFNNPKGSGKGITTRSVPWPAVEGLPEPEAVEQLAATADKVLRAELGSAPFHLTKINLAAYTQL